MNYALHIIGPDDVVAFPGRGQALVVAEELTKHFADSDPVVKAEVVEWDGDWESHGEAVQAGAWKEFWKEGKPWRPFWVSFKDRSPGCVEAVDKDHAMALAEAHGTPISADVIGYPADPRLEPFYSPKWGECPSFCIAPERCKGGSCVNPYGRSCTS